MNKVITQHRHSKLTAFVSAAALGCTLSSVALADDDPLALAIATGMPTIDVRYRAETVSQDGLAEDAMASTIRTRLGYKTGEYHGLYINADMEDIRVLGDDDFNSTTNSLSQYPVVADPEDTELNQAYLGYRGLGDTEFKLGRQRITLDDHRFVGNVGWRQNEQTYDAFTVNTKVGEKTSIFYGHVNNVNRIFGDHHPNPLAADMDVSADLANLSFKLGKAKLTTYAYLIESDDNPMASNSTLGARLRGKYPLNKAKDIDLLYKVEYAQQADYKDGASIIDADYSALEVGMKFKKLTAKVGYEVLGGDGMYAFSTPFATLHAFNGWADKFLATPVMGLTDAYVSVGAKPAGFKLLAVFHDFSADEGGADYGTELDLVASRKIGKLSTAALKYARYSADTFATDTDKVWFQWQVKF